jgi:hypothetical protein
MEAMGNTGDIEECARQMNEYMNGKRTAKHLEYCPECWDYGRGKAVKVQHTGGCSLCPQCYWSPCKN